MSILSVPVTPRCTQLRLLQLISLPPFYHGTDCIISAMEYIHYTTKISTICLACVQSQTLGLHAGYNMPQLTISEQRQFKLIYISETYAQHIDFAFRRLISSKSSCGDIIAGVVISTPPRLLQPYKDVYWRDIFSGGLEKFQSASLCRCSYLQHIYAWFN
jgi:hypothetical protein